MKIQEEGDKIFNLIDNSDIATLYVFQDLGLDRLYITTRKDEKEMPQDLLYSALKVIDKFLGINYEVLSTRCRTFEDRTNWFIYLDIPDSELIFIVDIWDGTWMNGETAGIATGESYSRISKHYGLPDSISPRDCFRKSADITDPAILLFLEVNNI